MSKRIRVIGLDADGCILNTKFLTALKNFINNSGIKSLSQKIVFNMVKEANKDFLEQLVKENKSFDKTILCITSNRQSFYIDLENSSRIIGREVNADDEDLKLISFFSIIELLGNEILNTARGDYLEKTTLADCFGFNTNGEDGIFAQYENPPLTLTTAYWIATQSKSCNNHPISPLDYSKTLLICNLTRKIRHDNPNAEIQFDMFDDRCSFELAEQSNKWQKYNENTDLQTPDQLSSNGSPIMLYPMQRLNSSGYNDLPDIFIEEASSYIKQETPKSTETANELEQLAARTYSYATLSSDDGSDRNSIDELHINQQTPTLNIVGYYFKKMPKLIPSDISLNLLKYDGSKKPEHFVSITGMGNKSLDDVTFADIIKIIAKQSGCKKNPNINAGENLNILHSALEENTTEIQNSTSKSAFSA
tara:strand:- start:9008 stop:10270 length:1263 start_codon:yes stop_codon:yes gene_type:complete